MKKRKQETFIKGSATNRRTEGDYMGILLDTVTLDDWRDVVTGTLRAAKEGDPQARAWLAQYLVGKPVGKAPTPLTVVAQQLNNIDPVLEKVVNKIIMDLQYPEDDWTEQVKEKIEAELVGKIGNDEYSATPQQAMLSGNLGE